MTTKETVAGLFSVEYVLKVGCPMQSINDFHDGNYFNHYPQKLELVATTIFMVIIIIARLCFTFSNFVALVLHFKAVDK